MFSISHVSCNPWNNLRRSAHKCAHRIYVSRTGILFPPALIPGKSNFTQNRKRNVHFSFARSDPDSELSNKHCNFHGWQNGVSQDSDLFLQSSMGNSIQFWEGSLIVKNQQGNLQAWYAGPVQCIEQQVADVEGAIEHQQGSPRQPWANLFLRVVQFWQKGLFFSQEQTGTRSPRVRIDSFQNPLWTKRLIFRSGSPHQNVGSAPAWTVIHSLPFISPWLERGPFCRTCDFQRLKFWTQSHSCLFNLHPPFMGRINRT